MKNYRYQNQHGILYKDLIYDLAREGYRELDDIKEEKHDLYKKLISHYILSLDAIEAFEFISEHKKADNLPYSIALNILHEKEIDTFTEQLKEQALTYYTRDIEDDLENAYIHHYGHVGLSATPDRIWQNLLATYNVRL